MLKRPGHRRTNGSIAILFLAATIVAQTADAQIASDWDLATSKFEARVKSVDFFIDRFNNQLDGTGSNLRKPDSANFTVFNRERSRSVVSLFDIKSFNKKDPAVKENLLEFLSVISDPVNPVFLHFEDHSWFATISFDCTLDGRSGVLNLYVQTERDSNGVYTWNARYLDSKSLQISQPLDNLTFAPSAHGTDFIDVRLKLKEKGSNLLSDVSRKLVLGKIREIDYEFCQVQGWRMEVSYVNRNDFNSGWLIRSLDRLTTNEKDKLLSSKNLR